MKLNTLALASMIAVASTGAIANDVNSAHAVVGGTTYFGALHTDNFDFTDVFTFNVAGPLKANASMITIGANLQNIDFLSADLNGAALTLSPNGFVEFGSIGDTNLTGPLILTVKGKSGAAGGTFASYSGTVNVTAVPEPETYAMMLAGLGIVGFLARRRRSV